MRNPKMQIGGGQQLDVKFWIDFKNLNENNKILALQTLENLCKTHKIPRKNLIIESSDYKALRAFKEAGFYTSYYFPYYDKNTLSSDRAAIHENLKEMIAQNSVNAVSFDYSYYDFIKSLELKYKQNGKILDMPLLTWNIGKNWVENTSEKAYKDSQIEVILVRESGEYR